MKQFKMGLMFVLMFSSVVVQAQRDFRAEIITTLEKYQEVTNKQDYAGIVDMMYPKIFELAPKEVILNQLQTTFEEAGMSVFIDDLGTPQISELYEHDGEEFALIGYDLVMSTVLEDTGMLSTMYEVYQMQFGEENTILFKDEKRVQVKGKRTMFAITPKGTDNWTVIEKKKEQEMLLNMLIPEEVMTHFNKE